MHATGAHLPRTLLLCGALIIAASPGALAACSQSNIDREKTVVVWAMASKSEHWRADNAVTAMERLQTSDPGLSALSVYPINLPGGAADYKKKFTLAAEAERGPDIAVSGHEDIPVWASAGYIVPLAASVEELLARFPGLARVHPRLWPSCTWNSKVWAVPQDVEARPMFFSKTKLAELGWSEPDIAGLPDRIARGDFTLEDMLATARQAVEKGIVRRGYGFWHRSRVGGDHLMYYVAFGGRLYSDSDQKLVITRKALGDWFRFQTRAVELGVTPATLMGTEKRIWRDTVAHQNVLFWQSGTYAWSDWAENYLKDSGGGAYLEKHTGYALIPSGIRGQPAGTLSHPLVYMVTRPEVSGQSHQDLSIRILAAITEPDLDARHALDSAHLSIMKEPAIDRPIGATGEDRQAVRRRFLRRVTYMLDHNYYLPNSPYYAQYFDVIWENMVAVATGRRSPGDAIEETIAELEIELGDELLVE